MILIENAVALMILGSLDAPLFEGADMAIVRCTGFATIDVRLPALECAGLAVGERAAIHAVGDALLLIHVALHIALCRWPHSFGFRPYSALPVRRD